MPKVTQQEKCRQEDRAFILDYANWPQWPWLPLKRRNNSLEDKNLGVMMCDQHHDDAVRCLPGSQFTVYHVYLYNLPKSPQEWKDAPKTTYPTIDALLADGWVVD